MNPIDQLKAVLCDPNGKCCIDGSDEDRAIIDRALQALAQPRKKWIGLTDEERNEMVNKIQHDQFTRQRDLIGSTQIITEMYLKERNT
jgi:acyl-CoA reductase-like NAD-dependent aldehyde dehydrogenase